MKKVTMRAKRMVLFKFSLVWLVMFGLAMIAPSAVQAQGDAGLVEAVGVLTVSDVVVLVFAVVSLIAAVGAAVYAWAVSKEQKSLAGLDETIAQILANQRQDPDSMETVEKLVNGMTREFRESLKETAQIAVEATKFVPVDTLRELAKIYYEAVDGVPVRDKRIAGVEEAVRDAESVATALERQLYGAGPKETAFVRRGDVEAESDAPGSSAG